MTKVKNFQINIYQTIRIQNIEKIKKNGKYLYKADIFYGNQKITEVNLSAENLKEFEWKIRSNLKFIPKYTNEYK